MFKKVTIIALAGIIGVGTMIGASSSASAVETADYKSKAKIQFTDNEEPTLPVDPTDPEVPVTPVDPDEDILPGTPGPLSIDYASHFNFGEITKTANAQTHKAALISVGDREVLPYVQVTDNRGSNTGWALSVDQEGQLETGEDKLLVGAEITIGKGAALGTLIEDDEGVITNEVILNPETGNKQEIFEANAGTVGGTFVSAFGTAEDVDVTLTIPAGTEIDTAEYTTDLNWTLEDAPTTP